MIDLTVTSPASAGLVAYDAATRDALADPHGASYEPDPRGLLSAREAVARACGAPDGSLDPARVFLTSSTSEAYAHLFRLLCEPGDEIVIPRPCYPLLEPIAQLEDVRLASYRLAYDGDGWRLDGDSLEGAIGPRTRAVVLIEPNNPTGSVTSDDERRFVERVAERRGLAIVADEVFREFPWGPGGALPTWSGTRAVPTFVLGGISKSCGLPQLKCGWIAASGPTKALAPHVEGLEWILDLFLSVGTPVQLALPRLLAGRGAFQGAALERIRGNLERWRRWASLHGAEILSAAGGWSVIVRLPAKVVAGGEGRNGFDEWALERMDVLVHPAHFYDLDDDRHIVASLLPRAEDVEEALRRLAVGITGDPER